MENFSPNSIEEPKSGIPLELVVGKVLEDIICPICRNLVWNCVDCSACGSLFCEKCLKESLTKVNNACPMCRKSPFNYSDCKALKKLFKNIQIKCPNKPCNTNIEYSDYITHLKKCPFRIYHCNNDGCNFEISLDNINKMKEQCEVCKYRTVECNYCGEEIKEKDYMFHVKNKCTQIIECIFCNEKMERCKYYSEHLNKINIKCLIKKVEYYKNKYKKCSKKLEELESSSKNEIDTLKKRIFN